jgi:hypothetical protein
VAAGLPRKPCEKERGGLVKICGGFLTTKTHRRKAADTNPTN